MCKKCVVWLAKAIVSAAVALGIVSCFCYFYYNLPVHYTNESGATDYYWDENHLSMRGIEGFSYTQTDENGFVNTYPEKQDQVDVLLMGSSHIEAFNVNADENATYLLNQMFKESGQDKYAYCIGTSAHNFVRCLNNLANAVETYRPTDCVVIETSAIEFDTESLTQLNDGTFPVLPSYNSGLIYQLQKLDFFRLAHSQLTNFIQNGSGAAATEPAADTAEDLTAYQEQLETALQSVAQTAANSHCRVVIVYCPPLEVDYYGNIKAQPYTAKQELFKQTCDTYGIDLIDMYEPYKAMYDETRHLPTGFSNTAVGQGHTNKYGHRCIAETLYDFIAAR